MPAGVAECVGGPLDGDFLDYTQYGTRARFRGGEYVLLRCKPARRDDDKKTYRYRWQPDKE